ncbi:hypothetical protein FPZ24_08070 [Sphingomonas panacisoli]|uniref:Uncharacterized protein n=1 Tax=Sphingomonas panacisoli TaxID=1813879 RepID=A0A5B8LHZ6_9SPHN|nr:hypothetical protein [Sphingomonas panacisoli]QDZ07439.1 hypothetical protein FPZ24_08070 [Sphingomonas panacisoli]
MTPRERTLVALALATLEDAQLEAKRGPVQTNAVRLALRTLLPHVAQRWPLEQFWDGAGGDNEIGRGQSLTASLNGIVLQLKAKGWRED